MRKIIFIVLGILALGVGIFIFFSLRNSGEIELDEYTTSTTSQSIESISNDSLLEKENEEAPYYEDIMETKETSEFTKLYSRFKNKGLDVAYYNSVVDIICRPDQKWRINETPTYKGIAANVNLKNILSKDFTDKYNEKDGVIKAKGYDFDYLDTILFTPTYTENKVYVEYAKDNKEHILIGNLVFNNYDKITDIDFYLDFIFRDYSKNSTFGDPYEVKQVVGLYEETFVDGIVNYCIDREVIKKSDLDSGPTTNIELEKTNFKEPNRKGTDNLFSKNLIQFGGLWIDENKKYYSWEDKFVNISGIVEIDGKDYRENYIVIFDVKDNKLSNISFTTSTRKLIGDSDKREERKRKAQQEFEEEMMRTMRKLEISLKEKETETENTETKETK